MTRDQREIERLRAAVLGLLAVKHLEKLTLCGCVIHVQARAALKVQP